MSADLPCNYRYAETEEEEMKAEDDMDSHYDEDDIYDRIRDENTETLMEDVKKLIEDSSKLMYYKHRNEGLAKDIIQFVLSELKLKIESVNNLSPTYQSIDLIKKEEVLING